MNLTIIAGLGNPGERYQETRHNVGFLAVEALAQRWSLSWKRGRFESVAARGGYKDWECLLVKPQIFMNRSGECLAPFLQFYKASLSDLIVLHDDLDLPLGRLKIQWGGGDAGHRGIRSLIDALNSQDFIRFRLGIGRPSKGIDPVEYVLKPWERSEKSELSQMIGKSVEALECLLEEGVEVAMNRYHGPQI
ncbi:MAG: aminoacyl-tRNA hydrolase [Deltaproteobacteria bacterium]|nr:aminoacyl-tRNA hydrolase [Deltaproteobacteria bacterium]